MTQTYNPIKEQTDLPGGLFGTRVRPPALRTALVLERPAAEPIVVWHGNRMPSTRLKEHRRYVIDVASHALQFEIRAASMEAVFPFKVSVSIACRVLDPLTIARDDVQDMVAALLPSFSREIRDTAAQFDVLQPTDAARAIENRLKSAYPSPVVELSGHSVHVTPLDTQGVVAAQQELGVQTLRREGMKAVSHGTLQDQLGQMLATNNGDSREMLAYFRKVWQEETAAHLSVLQIKAGGSLDDVDLADVQKKAFGKIFGVADSGESKREKLRERLERKDSPMLEQGDGQKETPDEPKVPEGKSEPDDAVRS